MSSQDARSSKSSWKRRAKVSKALSRFPSCSSYTVPMVLRSSLRSMGSSQNSRRASRVEASLAQSPWRL